MSKRPLGNSLHNVPVTISKDAMAQRSTSSLSRSNTATHEGARKMTPQRSQTTNVNKLTTPLKLHQTVIDGPLNIFKGEQLEAQTTITLPIAKVSQSNFN